MTNAGPPPQRRPGDGNDFDRKPIPEADFLGAQSSSGNSAGLDMLVNRIVRSIFGWFRRRPRA